MKMHAQIFTNFAAAVCGHRYHAPDVHVQPKVGNGYGLEAVFSYAHGHQDDSVFDLPLFSVGSPLVDPACARSKHFKLIVSAIGVGLVLSAMTIVGVVVGTRHRADGSSSSAGALQSAGRVSISASTMIPASSSSSASMPLTSVLPISGSASVHWSTAVTATSTQPLPSPTGMPTNAQIDAADPLAWPNLQMISDPSGHYPKSVAFSFDDGPDGGNSAAHTHILDQLRLYNMKATFFVNGNASADVLKQPSAQAALRRTLAEGHAIGSHTYSHPRLSTLSPVEVVAQFDKNIAVLGDPSVLGPDFKSTLIRVPFGAPIQANSSDVLWIAPLIAPYGVHVGWGIDTKDYECAADGADIDCIIERFASLLDAGRSGVILMHSIYMLSGDALPSMFQQLWDRNYRIVTVEEMVAAKYGAAGSSAVMEQWAKRQFSADEIAASAFNASRLNNDIGTAK